MLHILFVINSYSTGGISSSLKSILNSQLKNYFKFSVFSLTEMGSYAQDFKPWTVGNNYWTSVSRLNRDDIIRKRWFIAYLFRTLIHIANLFGVNLKRVFDKWSIRILENQYHFDRVVAFSEGEPTRFVARFHNLNRIAWIHCDYSRCVKDRVDDGDLYAHYYRIVCVSKFTEESFTSLFPQHVNRTTHIYNLFDTNRIIQLSKERINNPVFDSNYYTIISVGRICEVKRFGYIPHIASVLKNNGHLFRWYIIGPQAEHDAYQELVGNIITEHVEDAVVLLGAVKNPYPYFLSANLLVSLSWSEACPMVFNEAKVLNLPIISTNFASAQEFINEKEDGVLRPLNCIADVIDQFIKGNFVLNKKVNHFDQYNSIIIDSIINLFNANNSVEQDD